MENAKQEILKAVKELPEDITWEDALYTLYIRYNIKQSEDDFKNGRYITLEELREHIDRLEGKYVCNNIRQNQR